MLERPDREGTSTEIDEEGNAEENEDIRDVINARGHEECNLFFIGAHEQQSRRNQQLNAS